MLARALAWSQGDTIDESELRDALMHDLPRDRSEQLLNRPLGDGFSLESTLDELARHYLTRAREEAGSVKTKAAGLLGFANYQTYDNWCRRLLAAGEG